MTATATDIPRVVFEEGPKKIVRHGPGDYEALLDNQPIGFFPNREQAVGELDRAVFDQLSRESGVSSDPRDLFPRLDVPVMPEHLAAAAQQMKITFTTKKVQQRIDRALELAGDDDRFTRVDDRHWTVEGGTATYTVTADDYQGLVCDCPDVAKAPGRQYHHHGMCKHALALMLRKDAQDMFDGGGEDAESDTPAPEPAVTVAMPARVLLGALGCIRLARQDDDPIILLASDEELIIRGGVVDVTVKEIAKLEQSGGGMIEPAAFAEFWPNLNQSLRGLGETPVSLCFTEQELRITGPAFAIAAPLA
jgi:hypothetical protein